MKLCAIHQPNFFPWLGYFAKIHKADVFVILDEVQNQKTGGSWTNRTYLNCHAEKKFFTCPLVKVSGTQTINQIRVTENDISSRFLDVLKNYYKKYSYFNETYEFVDSCLKKYNIHNLCQFNVAVIREICSLLDINTPLVLQSELNNLSGLSSNGLLIEICKQLNSNTYLSGDGSKQYQEDSLFRDEGLEVEYNNFQCNDYSQHKEIGQKFIPGLSIIDYLMCRGLNSNLKEYL